MMSGQAAPPIQAFLNASDVGHVANDNCTNKRGMM